MATEKISNLAQTTLATTINSSDTTISVSSATNFSTSPQFRINIENEIILVTGVSGTTFTVTRGAEGTTATSHNSGAIIVQVVTAGALNQMIADNYMYGTSANRPAAEKAGRIYMANDAPIIHRDNGSSWDSFYGNIKLTLPITSSYSWTNGGGTATNTDVTNGGSYLSVTSTGTPDKISVFVKNVASAPYTITALFIPQLQGLSVAMYCGMCLYDGTKLVTFTITQSNTANILGINKWTSLTAFSAAYIQIPFLTLTQAWLLRITDDNTNRIWSYSNDGFNFTQIHSVSRTDFLTPTKVGMILGTNATATANGVPAKTSMNWLSWTDA